MATKKKAPATNQELKQKYALMLKCWKVLAHRVFELGELINGKKGPVKRAHHGKTGKFVSKEYEKKHKGSTVNVTAKRK